jgi:hypothetical protein
VGQPNHGDGKLDVPYDQILSRLRIGISTDPRAGAENKEGSTSRSGYGKVEVSRISKQSRSASRRARAEQNPRSIDATGLAA